MRAMLSGWVMFGFLAISGTLRADGQADAKAVIDKALKAMGGQDKVAPFRAGTCKGKVTLEKGGQQLSLAADLIWQGVDKARLRGEVNENGNNGRIVFAINGDKGWEQKNDNVSDAPAPLFLAVKNAFFALQMPYLLPELKNEAFKLSPLGEVKVNDRAVVGISVQHQGHNDVNVFFDKETGLPSKSEIRIADPSGKEITVEYLYGDFQEIGGVKHPTRISLKADDHEFVIEVQEIRSQDKIDDSEFVKP